MARRPPAKHRDINNLSDLRAGLYCRVSLDKDGTEKSVDDQEAVGREWVERVGARLDERYVYRDADRSASRFATKQREGFNRLLADIEAGELDVVWFWELSRSQRRLDVFAKLRDLCRDMGVLWVIRDRAYDPSNYADMMTLGMLSVVGENESEMTSLRVQRGKKSGAAAGRPPGKVPYGYRRVYDPNTGRSLRDVPNDYDGDGRPVEDSPAWIVREIFARVAAGDSITRIRRDLNDRGIPTNQGFHWDNFKVRYVAMNPTYLGLRIYQGQIQDGVAAFGPPLVDEETYWAVQRILHDPARVTTRPGSARHLLSSLVWCAECDGKLIRKNSSGTARGYGSTYACKDRSCVGITASWLDDYVERVVVAWLSDPATVADLTGGDDSATARQARVDADRARVELEEWRKLADRGEISAPSFARAEKGLLARIGEAERIAQATTLPPVLRGNIGPQAKAGWDALDLAGKRQIIRTVADIRVRGVGRGRRVHPAARVKGRWLLGDGADWPPFDPDLTWAPSHVKIRDRALELRAQGATYAAIAAELGVAKGTVAKALDSQDAP